MEAGIVDSENEMRGQLIKTLRVLIYYSCFEKHMLNVYSKLVYKPLLTEKKVIVPTNPGVSHKKQSETEMEVIHSIIDMYRKWQMKHSLKLMKPFQKRRWLKY